MPRLLRGLMLAVLSTVVLAAPASAHTELVSSDPVDGKTLATAPSKVSLRFGEELIDGGDKLVATNAAGDRIALAATVSGATISAPWPADQTQGAYSVSYRVVADDGHPLTGKINFTIKGQATPTAGTAATASAEPVAPASAPDTDSGGSGFNIIAALLLVAAAGVAGFFVWRSRAD